jgi:hypothetical protein
MVHGYSEIADVIEPCRLSYKGSVGPQCRILKPTSSHLQATMAAFLSSLLAGSALLNVVNAQDFSGGGRDEDAFSYIQPVDTVILTEYGSSPAVYPSRKFRNS